MLMMSWLEPHPTFKRGLAKVGHIGLYGWSYGGYLWAMTLARFPNVFCCAVSGAHVTAWLIKCNSSCNQWFGTNHLDDCDAYLLLRIKAQFVYENTLIHHPIVIYMSLDFVDGLGWNFMYLFCMLYWLATWMNEFGLWMVHLGTTKNQA